jgi:hypothetical protein
MSDAPAVEAWFQGGGLLVALLPAAFILGLLLRCGLAAILQEREGLDAVLGLVKEALPKYLRETAYALALEIVLTEAPVYAEENRILQRLKTTLDVDRLTAAALEKAAVVRHARITS